MGSTRRFAVVLVFVSSAAVAVAENEDSVAVAESGDSVNILAHQSLPLESKTSGLTSPNGKLCQLCEQYSAQALFYLQRNETLTELLSLLHGACANLVPLVHQCITLVDHYIPLFFLEFSVVEPEKFCESVHLCGKRIKLSITTLGEMCGICHHVLGDVLIMLRDPDMQREIVELLATACSMAESHAQQCKMMVHNYVPWILVKCQTLLETTDVCSAINACETDTEESAETMDLPATS